VTDPQARVAELIAHRGAARHRFAPRSRTVGSATAEELARAIYTDVAPALIPAATRNVLAHLIDLWSRNEIACAGGITPARGFPL
jgi:hypothetical protein